MARIDLARLDFPLLRTQQEFETGQLPATLVPARDAIVAARHVVLVFPLWHGTMPALVKAFLEQVMRPGVALEYREHGFPRRLLAPIGNISPATAEAHYDAQIAGQAMAV